MGPENTKRSGAGIEERGNAVVKKIMSSLISLMYVAPDRLVYCSCMTCGDWKPERVDKILKEGIYSLLSHM